MLDDFIRDYLERRKKVQLLSPNNIFDNRKNVSNIMNTVKVTSSKINQQEIRIYKAGKRNNQRTKENRNIIFKKLFTLLYNQEKTIKELTKEFKISRRNMSYKILLFKIALISPYHFLTRKEGRTYYYSVYKGNLFKNKRGD